MLLEILGWILLFGIVGGYCALWFIPSTRPYAKKLWWVALLAAAVGVAFIALRRRPGKSLPDSSEDRERGNAIAAETLSALDAIADNAREQLARQDVELARRRLESKEDVEKFDAQVAAVNDVESSTERRKALIKLVENA